VDKNATGDSSRTSEDDEQGKPTGYVLYTYRCPVCGKIVTTRQTLDDFQINGLVTDNPNCPDDGSRMECLNFDVERK
jgi:hypothetical protein